MVLISRGDLDDVLYMGQIHQPLLMPSSALHVAHVPSSYKVY